jgi:hypothetical protein
MEELDGGSPADWTRPAEERVSRACRRWLQHVQREHVRQTFGCSAVDMDCEQAFDDGAGRWFELGIRGADAGWESDVAQTSTPMPPYSSINHVGLCGMVNVFVANYQAPRQFEPELRGSSRRATPSRPLDERARRARLNNTPCVSPALELRCVGNVAQSCQAVAVEFSSGRFRTATRRRLAGTR